MPDLNRRGFLQSLAAMGAVPFLPAMPAPAIAATHTPLQLLWATYYAQMNNACSPTQITRALGVSPEVAQGLYDRLLQKGILTPSLSGHAARPRHPMADRMSVRQTRTTTTRRTPFRPVDQDWIMAQVTRDIARQIPFAPIA